MLNVREYALLIAIPLPSIRRRFVRMPGLGVHLDLLRLSACQRLHHYICEDEVVYRLAALYQARCTSFGRLWPGERACFLDCHRLLTIQSKDVMVVATVCAYEGRHVLYHSKDGYVDLLEQINPTYSIAERQILRR